MLNYKNFIIYFIAIFSLFLGLIFEENASGGARLDFEYLFPYIENFSFSLSKGLDFFVANTGSIIHSPVFYIITGIIYNLLDNIFLLKVFYILLCCTLPFLFFKILKNKYAIEKNVLLLFSLIIFISPYFRSSSIWLLGDNLSLIFFGLSIYFFNKADIHNNYDLKNCLLCLLFLILCCYIRYYYCLFSIYYLFIFYKKTNGKNFIILVLFSIIFAIPAIYYLYYIILNYDFFNTVSIYSQINFYRNGLIILSILLFYILPFGLIEKKKILKYILDNKQFFLILFLLFSSIFFISEFYLTDPVNLSPRGGGVFLKASNFFNIKPTLILSITSFISLIFFDFFFREKRLKNYFLLLILIFSFPIYTIYQKYFDPLFFIFFFGLITSKKIEDLFKKHNQLLFISFVYFFFFYLFSLNYYSKILL